MSEPFDYTSKFIQWLMMPQQHTSSDGSPKEYWDCLDSDGLIDSAKYSVFLSEQQQHEAKRSSKFQEAMTEMCLYQTMACDEEDDSNTNKAPKKRRKKGIVFYVDSQGKRKLLPPTMSMWYNLYCRQLDDDERSPFTLRRFQTKFRRRFRMPYDSYKQLCTIAATHPLFSRWMSTDAFGRSSAPIELLILTALRYLGRGWTFDDLEEQTAISEEVIRVFFHAFIEFGSTVLYDKFVNAHLIKRSDQATIHDFAKSMEVEYAQAGFPGCIGSMDATHIACEKVGFRLRQNHLSFKLPYTSRTYNLTCNHRRLIICTTDGHPARWNDKSIQHFDRLATGLNNGTLLPDLPFELYDYDNDGNIIKKQYRGAWLLTDNGYLAWPVTMPPISRTTLRKEIRWSGQIEAMRKDVECAFGILKGRWRVLKAGVRIHGVNEADKIFKTCVALHNWLLEVDGLAEEWGEGIPSDWEGTLGLHEEEDADRIPVPNAIRRLNNPAAARNYDTSGMGIGDDGPEEIEEHGGNEDQIIANVQEEEVNMEDGGIVVHKLSRARFRQRLVTHFDIAFHKREIKWPKRNSHKAIQRN